MFSCLRPRGRRADPVDDLSNDIVVFRGMSLAALFAMHARLLAGDPDTDLMVITDDALEATSSSGARVRLAGLTFCVRAREPDGVLSGSLAYIEGQVRITAAQAVPKARADWTIEDVCEYLVLPAALARGDCFYLDLLPRADVGHPFRGAFVSQARRCRFGDLVEALREHFGGRDATAQFVWLDLFSANQPRLTGADSESAEVLGERYKLLTRGLHAAIERFDERVIFFDDWAAPAPLSRMWCVWEVFGAVRSGRLLQVMAAPHTRAALAQQVVFNPDAVTDALAGLEMRDAQCHSASDRKMILDAVAALPGGFSELNGSVLVQVRALMAQLANEAALAQREASGRTTGAAQVLHQVGAVLCDLDDLAAGEQLLREARSIWEERLPPRHLRAAKTAHELGVVCALRGDLCAALELYAEAVAVYRVKQGPRDAVTVGAVHEMARVQWALGRFEAAAQLFAESFAGDFRRHGGASELADAQLVFDLAAPLPAWRVELLEAAKEHLGLNTRTARAALASMAAALFAAGRADDALTLLRRVAQLNEDQMGGKHPSTLTARHNVARALQAQGRHADAQALFEQVLDVSREQAGSAHSSTVATLRGLAQSLRAQGELVRARALFEQVLATCEAQQGSPGLARAQADLAGVLLEQGERAPAVKLLKKALVAHRSALGADHPYAIAVARQLKA